MEKNLDKLDDGLRRHYEEVDRILGRIDTPAEKTLFLDGLLVAFDAMHVYASPAILSSEEREDFFRYAGFYASAASETIGEDPSRLLGRTIRYEEMADSSFDRARGALRRFQIETDHALSELDLSSEKVLFLTGLMVAFDAIQTLAAPEMLQPLERENFISSAKSNAFSIFSRLDSESSRLFYDFYKNGNQGERLSFAYAFATHKAHNIPIGPDQAGHLLNLDLISFEELSAIMKQHFGD